jgi:hypothetical protein
MCLMLALSVKLKLNNYGNPRRMSLHIYLACELVTSLMKRGIQMREVFKLDCLIGVVQHAMWADYLFSYTCCYFQFPKS